MNCNWPICGDLIWWWCSRAWYPILIYLRLLKFPSHWIWCVSGYGLFPMSSPLAWSSNPFCLITLFSNTPSHLSLLIYMLTKYWLPVSFFSDGHSLNLDHFPFFFFFYSVHVQYKETNWLHHSCAWKGVKWTWISFIFMLLIFPPPSNYQTSSCAGQGKRHFSQRVWMWRKYISDYVFLPFRPSFTCRHLDQRLCKNAN